MRTYDDTFSGDKIYPGKVCSPFITRNVLHPADHLSHRLWTSKLTDSAINERENSTCAVIARSSVSIRNASLKSVAPYISSIMSQSRMALAESR